MPAACVNGGSFRQDGQDGQDGRGIRFAWGFLIAIFQSLLVCSTTEGTEGTEVHRGAQRRILHFDLQLCVPLYPLWFF